jgi:hypothetical protein
MTTSPLFQRAGRARNQLETVQLTVATTQPVVDYLQDLVLTGLFGKNPSEAAERLLANGIEQLIRESTLLRRRAAQV